MDAKGALAGLKEISDQVEHAVVFDSEGSPVASTLAEKSVAERIAEAAVRLLSEAESVRPEGSEPVAQLEAATRHGSVFVVREGENAIAATTPPSPTIGLVMYDLRTCLRSLDAEPPEKERASPAKAKEQG